jgi:4-amino-4-deoxy-L-arabinose transferase-like glycosyltransferase
MNIPKITKSFNPAQQASVLVNVLGFVVLLTCVLLSPHSLIYDEVYHLPLVGLLNQYGLSYRFLRGTGQSAPGPLYSIIHYIFQPLTDLEAPAIRLVNILLLLLLILVLSLTLQKIFKIPRALVSSLAIMGLPMIWVITGMALTEISAMLLATLSVFLIFLALEKIEDNQQISLGIAALSGLCLGMAILGRQTFIVLMFILPILTISSSKKSWQPLLLCWLTSGILPAIVFSVWGGIVPPGQSSLSSGYSLRNGFLSFAYTGLLLFILAPKWFSLSRAIIISVLVSGFLGNAIFTILSIRPAYHVFKKIIPDPTLLNFFFYLASSCLLAFGILFLIASLNNCRDHNKDSKFLFLNVAVIIVAATAFKITHYYSTRYTATAIPFLILLAQYYTKDNYFKVARLLLGNIVGCLMLVSYFLRPWP